MSYDFGGEREYVTDAAPDIGPLRSGRHVMIAVYVVLALIGSGAAFLWQGYEGAFQALPIFGSETTPQMVPLKSFDEYQRAVASNLRSYSEKLEAQDVGIKRLADQVLNLTTRIDSLESRARDAQAAVPPAPREAIKKPAGKPRIPTGDAPSSPARDEKQ
jgi:hypothetical protein